MSSGSRFNQKVRTEVCQEFLSGLNMRNGLEVGLSITREKKSLLFTRIENYLPTK